MLQVAAEVASYYSHSHYHSDSRYRRAIFGYMIAVQEWMRLKHRPRDMTGCDHYCVSCSPVSRLLKALLNAKHLVLVPVLREWTRSSYRLLLRHGGWVLYAYFCTFMPHLSASLSIVLAVQSLVRNWSSKRGYLHLSDVTIAATGLLVQLLARVMGAVAFPGQQHVIMRPPQSGPKCKSSAPTTGICPKSWPPPKTTMSAIRDQRPKLRFQGLQPKSELNDSEPLYRR